jgi:Spy/CpxP family protein refolding chaperone
MKNFKQILCILLIFLLGAASGGLVMHMIYKSHMETFLRGDRKAREEILLDRLTRRLDLDDRQREQVRAIVEQTHAEMNNIRKQYRPQMEAVLEKSRVEMRQILRPGQLEKFEQFLQKRKEKREREHRN